MHLLPGLGHHKEEEVNYLEQIKQMLSICTRHEIKHAGTGSRVTISWTYNGDEVADGYYSDTSSIVRIYSTAGVETGRLDGADALALRKVGNEAKDDEED